MRNLPEQCEAAANGSEFEAPPTSLGLRLPEPKLDGVDPVNDPETDELLGRELPKDLKSGLELWAALGRKYRASLQLPTADRKRLQARMKVVGAKVHAMQQVAPVPVIDLNELHASRHNAITSAETIRQSRIDALSNAIGKDGFADFSTNAKDEFILAFLGTTNAAEVIAHLRASLAAYELGSLRDFLWLDPQNRRAEHKLAVMSNPSDDTIETVTSEAAQMAGEHFAAVGDHKRRKLLRQFDESVLPGLKLLLRSGLLFVIELKMDAVLAESDFFEQHGLKSQATAVSSRYDAVIKVFEFELSKFEPPTSPFAVLHTTYPTLRDSNSTALTTVFGVNIL